MIDVTSHEMKLGELLKTTWNYGKDNFVELVKVGVVCVLPMIVVMLFGGGALAATFAGTFASIGQQPLDMLSTSGDMGAMDADRTRLLMTVLSGMGSLIIPLLLLVLLMVVVMTLASNTLNYWLYEHMDGKKRTYKEAFQMGWKRLGAVFLTGLLVAVVLLVGFGLPLFLGGMISAVVGMDAGADGLKFLMMFIGMVFCLYFMVRWMFAANRALLLKETPVQAIKGSGAMVKGRWWIVLGRYLGLVLLTFLVSLVLGIPLEAMQKSSLEGVVLLGALLNFVISVLVSYFGTLYFMIWFKNMVSLPMVK